MAETKECRRCHATLPVEKFVDGSGDMNPRGYYCRACHLKRVEARHRAAIKKERSYVRKLKIVYGAYWRHYAAPEYFHTMLRDERDFCPYCGTRFCDVVPDQFNASPVHIDHMDPLDRGGEHSIRNAVLCCGPCNIKKGKRSFGQWLDMLEPEYRKLAGAIYVEKHGHPPAAFVEGDSTVRRSRELERTLYQSEEDLEAQFPEPKVSGPPSQRAENRSHEPEQSPGGGG